MNVLSTWRLPPALLTPDAPNATLKKLKNRCLPAVCGLKGLPPAPADSNSRPVPRPVAEAFSRFPWQLTYIAVAVFTGIFIDKWGIRISLFLGVVVISLSASLRYFVGGGMTLLLTVALFGIGGPMVSISAPKTISMWFKGKERSTAVGIYVTGARLGQMVCLAATNSLIMPMTGYSWRLTFLFYGYLTFGAALIWWLFARDIGTAEASENVSTNQVILRLVREPSVRIPVAAEIPAILQHLTRFGDTFKQ